MNLKVNLNKEVAVAIRKQLNKMKPLIDDQNTESSNSNGIHSSQLDQIIQAIKVKANQKDLLEMMKEKTNKNDTEQQMKALEVLHKQLIHT